MESLISKGERQWSPSSSMIAMKTPKSLVKCETIKLFEEERSHKKLGTNKGEVKSWKSQIKESIARNNLLVCQNEMHFNETRRNEIVQFLRKSCSRKKLFCFDGARVDRCLYRRASCQPPDDQLQLERDRKIFIHLHKKGLLWGGNNNGK